LAEVPLLDARCLALTVALGLAALARGASAGPETAYQELRWRLLGPMRAGWSLVAQGVPDRLDTYYFGAADGGVWKTTDSGLTWSSLGDRAPFSSVNALAVVPRAMRPTLLVVGTGQTQTRYDAMDGGGVFVSDDDGANWKPIGLTQTRHIGDLWVDPRDENVMLVAALGSLFGPGPERGVFRTDDGGRTWTKVAFLDADTGAVDLAVDPATPDVIYASFWQVRRYPWQGYHIPQVGPGSGIWKSADGGRTWTRLAGTGLPGGPLGKIGLAVGAGSQGRRVYALVDAQKDAGVYRSDDGGLTWIAARKDRSLASTYFGRLVAHPKRPDVVYVMGQSCRRSGDAGANWTFFKGSPGGDDYHDMWINPAHPERMILASDQGTTVTVNGGATWSPWYNQPTGQFYRVATDDRFPYRVYSGQQDAGTVALSSRSSYGQLTFRDWHPVGGDERDADIPDPENPDFVYGAGLGGRLTRWDARTGRVANVSPWPVSSYGQDPRRARYRTTWITPIAVSPRKPHALYWGTQFLFRSTDKGWTWEKASPDLTGAVAKAKGCDTPVIPVARATACGLGVIFAIAPSPAADGLVWVGTDNGRVHVTRDDGRTWSDVTPRDLGDWSQVAAVDASPTEPGTATLAVDRHRLDDRDPYVWRTRDFGRTWKRIDAGLPRGAYVNVVREDPSRPGLLYAGTREGVRVSTDEGATWTSLQLNLPRTAVNDIVVKGNDVVVATQGRAIWVLDDVTPLRRLLPEPKLQLAAPAPAVRLAANENRDTPLPPEMNTTPNPPAGAVFDYVLAEPPAGPVTLEVRDAAGALVRRFASDSPPPRPAARQYFADRWLLPPALPGTRAGHNRFVWDLRGERPRSTEYEYTIRAVPGVDTPIAPQGALVRPGRYQVRVSADGQSVEQAFDVLPDPRLPFDAAALDAQLALLGEVERDLARVAEAVEVRAKSAPGGAADGAADGELAEIGSTLAALLNDLEGADGPPTRAQRELRAELAARVEKALATRP
jgi:photosystem II stability/assembly factor-like uncharacterized protein